MKSKTSILFALLISSIAVAQSKVGTVNSDYLLSVMPEGKIVVKLTKGYAERLDSVFALKVTAYQNSLNEFRDLSDSISQDTKTVKLIEIQKFEAEVSKAKEAGTQLMRQKENELMRPLYNKLGEAIRAVAKENNYTQILTLQGNEFAYIDSDFDITELVMVKLNIEKPKVATEE
jgi:outer membrane protein|tara:strand:+ start:5852 stop:6376 length:525 start_codon:yes stop_codon:yes gene_type:complete